MVVCTPPYMPSQYNVYVYEQRTSMMCSSVQIDSTKMMCERLSTCFSVSNSSTIHCRRSLVVLVASKIPTRPTSL